MLFLSIRPSALTGLLFLFLLVVSLLPGGTLLLHLIPNSCRCPSCCPSRAPSSCTSPSWLGPAVLLLRQDIIIYIEIYVISSLLWPRVVPFPSGALVPTDLHCQSLRMAQLAPCHAKTLSLRKLYRQLRLKMLNAAILLFHCSPIMLQ